MKVLAIKGSPRKKGTSSRIADGFMTAAEKMGVQIKSHYLNGMKYRGCQGCDACKEKQEHCALNDDLTEVLNDIKDSDVVVFATPVYYSDVSGQFKSFFDRTWSLVKPDYMTNPKPTRIPPGKKAVLIITQGDGAHNHKDAVARYETFLTWYGFEVHVIRGVELGMAPEANVDAFKTGAEELAAQLLN